MFVDKAGEVIADVMTMNRALSGIPSASSILDTSNYTFHAISYGKDPSGFGYHAHANIESAYHWIPFTPDPIKMDSIIIHGGSSGGPTVAKDTWNLSGSLWLNINNGGPVCSGHEMAYDSKRKKVVLFGGKDVTALGETWEWDGSTWTQVATTGPAPRYGHAMAFDESRDRTVLFGGTSSAPFMGNGNADNNPSSFFCDTWEWDGTSWEKVTNAKTFYYFQERPEFLGANAPQPRRFAAMAYDKARRRVVLHGGECCFMDDGRGVQANPGKQANDTWEWNGNTWEGVKPNNWVQYNQTADPMLGTKGHSLCYHDALGKVVLFGGYTESLGVTSFNNTCYIWDGTNWTLQTNGSQFIDPRAYHKMAYSKYNNRLVLFGGRDDAIIYNDTWVNTGGNQYGLGSWGRINRNADTAVARYAFGMANGLGYEILPTRRLSPSANDGVIKVISYGSNSVSSYQVSTTASSIPEYYLQYPSSPTPYDTKLENKPTKINLTSNFGSFLNDNQYLIPSHLSGLKNYISGTSDYGQCQNTIIDPNVSSMANIFGCFAKATGSNYWIVSGTNTSSLFNVFEAFESSATVFNDNLKYRKFNSLATASGFNIVSGTLSSTYNLYNLMDKNGYLTFAPLTISENVTAYNNKSYLSGVLKTPGPNFPNDVLVSWILPSGDAGSLSLFGGVFHIGLWCLDIKEMLKAGYYPPYNFNSLNNTRKYRLFAKHTFNTDLLYNKDTGGASSFKGLFELGTLWGTDPKGLILNWKIKLI